MSGETQAGWPETETCDNCGHTDVIRDRFGQRIMAGYDGEMLCASCRVTARLEDGDFDE